MSSQNLFVDLQHHSLSTCRTRRSCRSKLPTKYPKQNTQQKRSVTWTTRPARKTKNMQHILYIFFFWCYDRSWFRRTKNRFKLLKPETSRNADPIISPPKRFLIAWDFCETLKGCVGISPSQGYTSINKGAHENCWNHQLVSTPIAVIATQLVA